MPRKNRVPSYRLHRASGQAVVTLSGHDHYLGVHGTAESHAAYARLLAEWQAGGRHLASRAPDKTVDEVLAPYLLHAQAYYVKHGQPTTQLDRVKRALVEVRRLYGSTPAADFGPSRLKAVRDQLVGQGLCRRYTNQLVDCIKRCWKWAVAEELVPPSAYEGLRAVEGLRRGRTSASESTPILPVEISVVEATAKHLTRDLAGMVLLGRHSGMRPGEVCALRLGDLDRSGLVWIYRPGSHKTEHHGRGRAVPLGPQAQAVLRDFLPRECPGCGLSDRPYRLGWNWEAGVCGPCSDRREDLGIVGPWPTAWRYVGDPGAHVFSPAESIADAYATKRAARKTPVQPSQQLRARSREMSRARRSRPIRDHWDASSYSHAILRTCRKHGIPDWAPNQLRHTYGTEVRQRFGLEAAQVILGHSRADVTQVYAERDSTLALRVAQEMG